MSGTATLTVLTPNGIELYGTGDMANANFAAGSVHSSTEAYAVNGGSGHTFHYIGTGFTYDEDNNFTGGQISEIDILSAADSTVLVTMVFDGGTIDAAAASAAFAAYQADNTLNAGQVTALFNPFAFNAQGNVGADLLSSYAQADTFVGGGGPGSTSAAAALAAPMMLSAIYIRQVRSPSILPIRATILAPLLVTLTPTSGS
jgi:hypothetical protein